MCKAYVMVTSYATCVPKVRYFSSPTLEHNSGYEVRVKGSIYNIYLHIYKTNSSVDQIKTYYTSLL